MEDKEIKKKVEEKQELIPEAVSSITLSVLTPKKKFPALFTLRDSSGAALLEKMGVVEEELEKRGYEPQQARSYGGGGSGGFAAKKPLETVVGRSCPKCGSPLVYTDTKKGRAIKCSTSKYDWKTKIASGCTHFEWADTAPPAPRAETDEVWDSVIKTLDD